MLCVLLLWRGTCAPGCCPSPAWERQKNSTFFWQQVFIPAKCVFIPALSNMKIANVHVGTIHRNVRIANWANAIFISVRNSHISLQFSPFEVWFLRGCLQFSYQFAILISVCNSHVTTSSWLCWFLRQHYDPTHQSATHIRLKQTISPCSTVDQNTRRQINCTGPQPPQIMLPPPCCSPPRPPLPLSFSSAASAAPTVLSLSW